MKNITVFYLKIFNFLEEKFSLYLNRRVFVMGLEIEIESAMVNEPSMFESVKVRCSCTCNLKK